MTKRTWIPAQAIGSIYSVRRHQILSLLHTLYDFHYVLSLSRAPSSTPGVRAITPLISPKDISHSTLQKCQNCPGPSLRVTSFSSMVRNWPGACSPYSTSIDKRRKPGSLYLGLILPYGVECTSHIFWRHEKVHAFHRILSLALVRRPD